jgi:2-haloacid dehalogenase
VFAALLRDAFALKATGIYCAFRDVATSSLQEQLAKAGQPIEPDRVDDVIAGFADLEAHADVAPAMRRLREARIRIVTLTNGNEAVTRKLLAKAEVGDLVEGVVSVDEVRHWKPHPAVYRHCARSAGVDPAALALVAAHA